MQPVLKSIQFYYPISDGDTVSHFKSGLEIVCRICRMYKHWCQKRHTDPVTKLG